MRLFDHQIVDFSSDGGKIAENLQPSSSLCDAGNSEENKGEQHKGERCGLYKLSSRDVRMSLILWFEIPNWNETLVSFVFDRLQQGDHKETGDRQNHTGLV